MADILIAVAGGQALKRLLDMGDGSHAEVVSLGGGPGEGVDVPTATPTSYNITCTVVNTEYSQALPANCRYFEFQARTEGVLRYAFVTGRVATPTAPYHTLKAGDYYFSPQLNQRAAPSTLYVASPTAGTVVELLAWV